MGGVDRDDALRLGAVAYHEYSRQMGGVSPITGGGMPPFTLLPDNVQEAWMHAALEVWRTVNDMIYKEINSTSIGGSSSVQ
jgi:hypothetical protein